MYTIVVYKQFTTGIPVSESCKALLMFHLFLSKLCVEKRKATLVNVYVTCRRTEFVCANIHGMPSASFCLLNLYKCSIKCATWYFICLIHDHSVMILVIFCLHNSLSVSLEQQRLGKKHYNWYIIIIIM